MHNTNISPREHEILNLIAHEHNTNEIAEELFISPHTVITHRKNLLSKMDVKNTAGLVRKGFEMGLLVLQNQTAVLTLLLIIIVSVQGNTQCNSSDWKALHNLYHSTNGDSWTNNTDWSDIKNNNSPTAGCAALNPHGVTFNANRVEVVNLSSNNLTGSLMSSLSNLQELKSLNLEDNKITGSIPTSLGNIATLEVLNLQRNRNGIQNGFTGLIPITNGSFPSLRILRLNKNSLTGGIPPQINDLTELTELSLHKNSALGGRFPEGIGNLTKLDILKIQENNMYGCFPPEVSAICSQLSFVNVDTGNSFDDTWANFCNNGAATCDDPFVTQWKTNNLGASGNTSITIPTTGSGYSYDVDLGNDGSYEFINQTGDFTYNFGSIGTYTIAIRGDFPRIYFNNGGDRRKILNVLQWGDISWTSMESAFVGCEYLEVNTTDSPDLGNVTDMGSMFLGCDALNQDVSNWNTSNVTDMNSLFGSCNIFNQDINQWDVSNVTDMNSIFRDCADFNKNIVDWEVCKVTDMTHMFSGCTVFNQDIGSWDVGMVTSFESTFRECNNFNQDIRNWTTSSATDLNGMFYNCTAFNQNLGNWDIDMVTDMDGMLYQVGMDVDRYDETLLGWQLQAVQSDITLNAIGLEYCASRGARERLIDDKGWNIIGDSESSPCVLPFITEWKTDNTGSSCSTCITIPTSGIYPYNYDVDVNNNGVYEFIGETGDFTYDFGAAGIYEVAIRGDFPHIYFNNLHDKDKIINVLQWGDIEWQYMTAAFRGCSNLKVDALDSPNLNDVSLLTNMFAFCTSLNSDIGHWDTDNITTFISMFKGCTSFNQDIGQWNTDKAISFREMFSICTNFNQDIGGWSIDKITDMSDMLYNTGMDINNYDATLIGWESQSVNDNIELGAEGIEYCASTAARQRLIDDHGWNITGDSQGSSCTNFVTQWKTDNSGTSCSSCIRIPTEGSGYSYDIDWDNDGIFDELGVTGDATHEYDDPGTYIVNIRGDFPRIYFNNGGETEKILNVLQWGDIEWNSMENAFHGCHNLKIDAHDSPDLSAVTSMSSMLRECNSFNEDISNWNTQNIIDMSHLFRDCSAFNKNIGNWNTQNVTSMNNMFEYCGAFNQNLGSWNVGNVTTMFEMLISSGMDVSNYDSTLIGWEENAVQSNVHLGANTLEYCASTTARQRLKDDHGWIIAGDSQEAGCDPGACVINTWKVNAGNTDWFDHDNWDLDMVPLISHVVVIPDNSNVVIAANTMAVCKLIEVGLNVDFCVNGELVVQGL